MQEITGAKPVRDANSNAPKAFLVMRSLGRRVNSVRLRVGAPFRIIATKEMKKLTAEQFKEYATDPLATDEKIRKWCNLPEDRYFTVAMWPEARAGEVRVTPELHRVVRMAKISKSSQT